MENMYSTSDDDYITDEQDELIRLKRYVKKLTKLLDSADEEDFFGTDGWRSKL